MSCGNVNEKSNGPKVPWLFPMVNKSINGTLFPSLVKNDLFKPVKLLYCAQVAKVILLLNGLLVSLI